VEFKRAILCNESPSSETAADPDFNALQAKLANARRAVTDTENEISQAGGRLEAAATAVCSTCLNLTYSVEFNYTYCSAIGDVSGRYEHLSAVARLKDGKFICSRFKAGGRLRGSP
jgi:hypothetical protein